MRSGFFAGMFVKSLVPVGAITVTTTVMASRARRRREAAALQRKVHGAGDVFALSRELAVLNSIDEVEHFLELMTKDKLRALLTDANACQKMFESVNRVLMKFFEEEYQFFVHDDYGRPVADAQKNIAVNQPVNDKYAAIRDKIFNAMYEVMAEKIHTIEDLYQYLNIIDVKPDVNDSKSRVQQMAQRYFFSIMIQPHWNATHFKKYIFTHKNFFALFSDDISMFNYLINYEFSEKELIFNSHENIDYLLARASTCRHLFLIIRNSSDYIPQIKAALLDEANENISQLLAQDLKTMDHLIYFLNFLQDDKNNHLKTGENQRKFLQRLGDHPLVKELRRYDHRSLLSKGVDMEAAVYLHEDDRPSIRLT